MASLGELYYSLGLDDKQFNEALEQAKKKVQSLGADVSVNLNIDAKKVAEEVQRQMKALSNGGVNLGANVDTSKIENWKALLEESNKELEELQSKLAKTSSKAAQSTINNDIERTNKRIAELQSKISSASKSGLSNIKPTEVTVVLNEESVAKVRAQLERLGAPIKTTIDIDKDKQVKVALDVNKNILTQNIRAALNNTQFKIKALVELGKKAEKVVAEVNRTALHKSVKDALASRTYKVKALVELQKKQEKLQLDVNRSVLGKNVREALKNQTFKAKLDLVINKASVQDAIRQAFAQAGLRHETTQSDVLNARIAEIQARSLNNAAIQQERLNQLKAKGVDITNRYTKAQGMFSSTLTRSSVWANQLGSQISNLFSIYVLERFIRNLYTIGGEFQKQQIALQNMIGDVDKGNIIFERIKDMAIVSPFTFSELSSYTKQMSAYGIEYEKLYDTTKRLADISAGVGVDMGRLILAFGQVRSAAVLRGQELRQFTEAGIPLVNELAKAFTEMEGKAVSAGEVFDKISRREVSFGMVKDILFDMTDPGGRFFEMQEKLAESLAGKWSNLKDAWSIMIADIAEDANGPLGFAIDTVSSLIRSWRDFLPVITAVTGALATYRLTMAAVAAVNAIAKATLNPIISMLGLMGGAVAYVWTQASATKSAIEHQEHLNSEMEKTISKNFDNESAANRYLDILSKTTSKESEKEALLKRQEASLDALRDMYGDIIEDVKLEELTTEKILEYRESISKATKEMNENALQSNIDSTLNLLNQAKAELENLKKPLEYKRSFDENGIGIVVKSGGGTKEEIQRVEKDVNDLQELYAKLLDRQEELWDRAEKLSQEDLTGWRAKADELIKGTSLQAPKEDQSIVQYLDYLKEEYDTAKSEFEKYAEGNPITAENKATAKALRDAANRVNIGLGGASFLEVKKEDTDKADKEAEKLAKAWAKSFQEGLKSEMNNIASQWDLYKQLFEATGDKQFAMAAFVNTQVWDDAALAMKKKLEEAMGKLGLDFDADFDISDKVAKELYGDLYDSWKQIKDRIEKNGIDLKINTANAIKNTQTIKEQIESLENQRDVNLIEIEQVFGADSVQYKSVLEDWNRKIQDLKTSLWELSPEFKKLFVDTTGMSVNQIENLRKEAQRILAIIQNGTENNETGMVNFEIDGNPYSIEQEAIEKLIEWINKLGKKTSQVQTSFKRLWSWISGDEYGEGENKAKLEFEDVAGDLANIADSASNAANSLSSMFDSLGDEKTADAFAFGANMLSGVSTIAKGIASKDPFAVVGGIAGIIGSIAQAHDKKLDRAIQRSQIEVAKLTNAYKNLESVLERQLGSATSNQTREMLDNLKSQREELAKQYKLEDDKKKSDRGKLEDYKQQIHELNEQIKYFYEDLANEQYGVDLKGWSSQIAEALIEAFATGEDAAKAFDNTVADILRNLATEAIKLQFIEPAMNNLRNYLFGNSGIFTDNSAKGTDLSANEAAGLKAELDKLKNQIDKSNEYWDKINEAVGGILDQTEDSEKGGLSKDIKGVTEDTAGLLASYINDIRQSVSVNSSLFERIATDDIPKMSIIAEAQLTQLSQIQMNTARNVELVGELRDLVNRVVDKGSNKIRI